MARFSLFIGLIAIVIGATFFALLRYWPQSSEDVREPEAKAGSLLMPKEIENTQIDDKAGAKIPLDIAMTDHEGKQVTLGNYLSQEDKRPLIITIGYYGCPMLCSLVLNGLVEGLKQVNYKIGQDYKIVSVSIDERETFDLAAKKRDAYLMALNVPHEQQNAWSFHVMSALDAKRLSDVVGFNYYFDKKSDQFAHGAGFFVVSPNGVLARTLFGITFPPADIKLALSEAADGKIGSFIDRVILSCFHYDPDSHRYGVYIFGVMRLGGILTIMILGAMLFFYFRGEKKRVTPLT